MSEETKQEVTPQPEEASSVTDPIFAPGDRQEDPEKADFSDPEVVKAFITPERDKVVKKNLDEVPDWDAVKNAGALQEDKLEPESVEESTEKSDIGEEIPEEVTVDEVAAQAAKLVDEGRKKVIKNPFARNRIVEKEKSALEAENQALRERLDRLDKFITKQEDTIRQSEEETVNEEDLTVGERLLREQAALKQELMNLRNERKQEHEMQVATGKLQNVSEIISREAAENPVFAEAQLHIAKVMARKVQKDPAMGRTDAEKRENFMRMVLSKHLEIADQGRDPIEWTYEQAMDFGFDPEESARRHGVVFEGEEDTTPQVTTATPAVASAKPKAAKPATPKESIQAARKKSEGTGTIAGLTGSPPKRFSAKNMRGKSDAEFRYELKRAVAAGEIMPGKRGNVGYDEIMREVAQER